MKKYSIFWVGGGNMGAEYHNDEVEANSELEAKVNYLLTYIFGDEFVIEEILPPKPKPVDISTESKCHCGHEVIPAGHHGVETGSRHNGTEEVHYRDKCYDI